MLQLPTILVLLCWKQSVIYVLFWQSVNKKQKYILASLFSRVFQFYSAGSKQ